MYALLFTLSVVTVMLSIVSMEERIVYHVKIGRPEPAALMTKTNGVQILNEYDLVEGGRFVQGLEFLN